MLQGGDCAETFAGSTADAVRDKLQTLLQMAVVLTYAASVPVVKIGRVAGQFAKPQIEPDRVAGRGRAARLPRRGGERLRLHARGAPARPRAAAAGLPLRRGHAQPLPRVHAAAATPTCTRCTPGTRTSSRESPAGQRYERLAGEIDRALAFMKACGADPEELHGVEFYSSHEGAAARVRAGADPDRQPHRAAVRRLRAPDLDRRAHPGSRRRARRVLPPRPQPDRRQARPDGHAGRR